MPTVLLIRHAQASFGSAEYDALSDLGRLQVEALVARGIRADRVVTGSLRRQQDTARPWLADADDGVAWLDPRWNEYDDDDVLRHHSTSPSRLERRPGDVSPGLDSRAFQVVLDDALRTWVARGAASPCAQTWLAFLDGATGAFAELAAGLRSGETALAITSSGVIAALAAWLIGLPSQAFVALNRVTVNTGITKIVIGRQGTTLVSFNDHAHLEGSSPALLTYR